MGWEPINYACGHRGQEQMYGKTRDRESRAEYLGRGLCPDCLTAQRQQLAEQGRAAAAAHGLPELTGSSKQIAWAEQIRGALVAAHTAGKSLGIATEYLAPASQHLGQSRAGWWIDNRAGVSQITRRLADYVDRTRWELDHGETAVLTVAREG